MGYSDYLRDLLAPLRFYNLKEGLGSTELDVEGNQFDSVYDDLITLENEAILQTAETFGLDLFEDLFPHYTKSITINERRDSVKALMRINEASFSLADIQEIINCCGIDAAVSESDDRESVVIGFSGFRGLPPNFDTIQWIVQQIVPCHLDTVYLLNLLDWANLETKINSWTYLEAQKFVWETLEAQ